MIGFNGGLIGKDRTTTTLAAIGVWTLDEQIKARRNLAWPALGSDPDYASVSLLLHGDGANGSTTFTDTSPRVKTMSIGGGTPTISSTQSKFSGGTSMFFDNPSSVNVADHLTTPSDSDFAFGTASFTVEAWIYQVGQAIYSTMFEIGAHGASTGIAFFTGSDGFRIYSGSFFGGSGNALTLNTWQHVAFCRDGSTLRMFLNGTQTSTATFTNNLTVTTNVSVAYAKGQNPSGTSNDVKFNGYIDDLRVTKGVARYTANFTAPTAPFPDQ
jgi:hypothetical protein